MNEVETRVEGTPGAAPAAPAAGSAAPAAAAPAESELIKRLKAMTLPESADFLRGIAPNSPENKEISSLEPDALNAIADQQEKNTRGTKPDAAPAAPAGAPAASVPSEEEETVTLKLRRSALGTYAPKERSTADAIQELIKGYGEKDKTISFYKETKVPNLEKALEKAAANYNTLKKEVDELKKAPQGPTQQPFTVPEDLPDVNEDEVDEFDKEGFDKLKKRSKALRDILKATTALKSEIAGLKKDGAAAPAAPAATSQPEKKDGAPAAPAGTEEDPLAPVFAEISEGQVDPQVGKFIRTRKPFKEVNSDYITFCVELAELSGIKKPFDDQGNMVEDTKLLVEAYLNPKDPEGEKIRTAVNQVNTARVADKKAAIALPEDFDKYMLTLHIREKQFVKRGGQTIDIGFVNAARIYRGEHPELFTEADPVQKKIDEQKKLDAAAAERNGKAVEVPTSQGAELGDHGYVQEQALRIMNSKAYSDMTPAEAEIVKTALKNAGASDAEIAERFKDVKQT
jgi:hypothetical protein